MDELWDPAFTLGFANNGSCCGYATSKARQCKMAIRNQSVRVCNYLLHKLSMQEPNPTRNEALLRRLAKDALCTRNHQNQVEDMVREWTARITEAFPAQPEVEPRRIRHRQGRRRTSTPPPPLDSSEERSDSTTPGVESHEDALLPSTQQSLGSSEREPPPVDTRFSRSRNSGHSSRRSSNNSPATSRSSIPAPSRILPITTANSSSEATYPILPTVETPTRTTRTTRATRATTSDSRTEQHPASTSNRARRPCTRTHVHRLPLDEECAICYDSAHMSTSDPADLVWCLSTCGRSVHRACFEAWRAQCLHDARQLTCPTCRGNWTEDCGCPTGAAAPVQRRRVVGDCPICQDGLHASRRPGVQGEGRAQSTWCGSGCGGNVHAECFAVWEAECRDAGREATCVVCRAVWTHGRG